MAVILLTLPCFYHALKSNNPWFYFLIQHNFFYVIRILLLMYHRINVYDMVCGSIYVVV